MFGFVRPAACRSSMPRSVTDGRPYPPLPRRAKKQKQDSTVFSQKTGNQRKWWGCLPPLQELLPPPTGRSPSLEEGGLGAARALSNFLLLLRVQGRNPGRFNGGYGVPRGFKGEKSKSPPNPLGLAERVYSFHRCGGPPPSRREVWGFAGQGLRPCRRLHIGALRSPLSPFARPLEAFYTTPGAGSQPCSFQRGLWGS